MVTIVAMLVIGGLTAFYMWLGGDGEVVFLSISAIAGLAGYQVGKQLEKRKNENGENL